MEQILAYLREQNLPESLIRDVKGFRAAYPVEERVQRRVGAPQMHFFGSDILQMAVAGILAGENILLCGPKATGKISWRKIWPGSLAVRFIMYRSM